VLLYIEARVVFDAFVTCSASQFAVIAVIATDSGAILFGA
jgi:hypothetical protein